jgi:hypothetical protein
LTDAFVTGVAEAPQTASPIELSLSALRSAAAFFPDDRRPYSRMRQSVIDDNPALQEREAHKLVRLGRALEDALTERGVDDLTADVVAQLSVMAFGIAFARWIRADERRSFEDVATDVVRRVGDVARQLEP